MTSPSYFSLQGRRALVTGGTSGIGRAVARRLVEAGAKVVIAGRRADGPAVADGIGAGFVAADVTDETQVVSMLDRAAQSLGGLDTLVLNAGIGPLFPSLRDTPSDAMRQLIEANCMSVFFGLKHGPSRMNDGGAIVCTSSAAGQVQLPGFAAYGASKAALNALVRSAALELGPRRIRVNAVCPGGFASEMAPYDAAEDARLGKLSPLGRAFASVEEIVGVYHLLVAAEGGFITGQLIHVDGGVNLGFTASVIDAL